jgi:hypothetical protein
VVDEVHVHKSRDLIDAIETGTGAREQPQIILITTSDDGTPNTIYDEKHTEVETLAADRGEPDHEHYGVIWAAPEGLDPFSPEAIRAANPNIGISVMEDYLVGKARKAQRTPSFMPTYERLHLNRRRGGSVGAMKTGPVGRRGPASAHDHRATGPAAGPRVLRWSRPGQHRGLRRLGPGLPRHVRGGRRGTRGRLGPAPPVGAPGRG